MSTWTVETPRSAPDLVTRCDGRRCRGKPIPDGETCTLLVDESRALSDPWNPDVRRYACASCTRRAVA